MKKMIQTIKNRWLGIAGAIIGSIGGYLYWRYIGCASGTCPITSSPYLSVFFGLLIASSLLGMLSKTKSENNK